LVEGATGDSTGGESAIMPYYDYPWDGILECVNGEQTEHRVDNLREMICGENPQKESKKNED